MTPPTPAAPQTFPHRETTSTGELFHDHLGMSLRDYFAGQALAAMTVAPDYSKGPCNYEMAERAYVIADSMMEIRSKEGREP